MLFLVLILHKSSNKLFNTSFYIQLSKYQTGTNNFFNYILCFLFNFFEKIIILKFSGMPLFKIFSFEGFKFFSFPAKAKKKFK